MPLPSPAQTINAEFVRRFGRAPQVLARAPGRVNLIGEHTDYNDGFVFPMALEHSTWVAAAARTDDQVHAASLDVHDQAQWPAGGWDIKHKGEWTSYVAGVHTLLRNRGVKLGGCDLLIHSEVPVGSGLSSSAALEMSTALALARLAGAEFEPVALADLSRQAEHEFAGVPCGIMDQYVSALAQARCAFLLDCRTRTWDHVPLQLGEYVVLIVNSGVKHKLASGEYAIRQKQCHAAVAYFQKVSPKVTALRDVDVQTITAHAPRMEPLVAARARHVVTENQRTQDAAAALRAGRLEEFGHLMDASHRSLRDDYAVSCRELDLLVDITRAVPGVLGARMTGGGFGGCIVAIVHRDRVGQVEAALRAKYDTTGVGPAKTILSQPGPGAAIMTG